MAAVGAEEAARSIRAGHLLAQATLHGAIADGISMLNFKLEERAEAIIVSGSGTVTRMESDMAVSVNASSEGSDCSLSPRLDVSSDDGSEAGGSAGRANLRIHPLSAKELELVDEAPACLTAPVLHKGTPGRAVASLVLAGRTGLGKAFRGPVAVPMGVGVAYGEDFVLTAELKLNGRLEELGEGRKGCRLMAVFDGHGFRGRDAARLAADKLLGEVGRTTVQLMQALVAADVEAVKRLQTQRYHNIDKHLETELRSPTGGTTCSTVELIRVGGRLFLVTTNVGDSPVLLVDNRTRRVRLLTGQHSWDNPAERERYLQRCAALGLEPREVVYGRINCGGMRMEDLKGGNEEPLFVYRRGTAEVCARTREHLCKVVERRFRNSVGGSQSVRRFVMERRTPEGEWEVAAAMAEHAHLNWGATVLVGGEGKIQMTRSLGDLQEKQTAYIWADPDVAILELEPDLDLTVIACTDGISDLWYLHELGDLAASFFEAQPEGEAQALAELILQKTLERGGETPGYGLCPTAQCGLPNEACSHRPKWDDVSVACLRIRTSAAFCS